MLHKKRKKKSDFSREADHIKQAIKKHLLIIILMQLANQYVVPNLVHLINYLAIYSNEIIDVFLHCVCRQLLNLYLILVKLIFKK